MGTSVVSECFRAPIRSDAASTGDIEQWHSKWGRITIISVLIDHSLCDVVVMLNDGVND